MPGSICGGLIVGGLRNCSFGNGACIARPTQALVKGEATVYAVLDEVPGVLDTRIAPPSPLAARGVSALRLPRVGPVETAALRHSAEVLRQAIVPKRDACSANARHSAHHDGIEDDAFDARDRGRGCWPRGQHAPSTARRTTRTAPSG